MNLQLIRKYSIGYPGGLHKLAEDAGMSEANLHRCIRNNKIQAGDLEAISRLLNVKIGTFFTRDTNAVGMDANGFSGDISWMYEKIELLEQQIKDKNEIIKLLLAMKHQNDNIFPESGQVTDNSLNLIAAQAAIED